MAATESDITAKLIERLLADPAFRDRFRRDPAAACREAGLDSLADEMAVGAGKAMHTLDMRESRSSLAGVVMAAAMEGMGLYEFSRHVVPQVENLSGSVGDVLSRVNLPALPGGGSLAGTPPPSAAPVPATDAAADGTGGGAGASAAPAAPVAPTPVNGAAAAPVAPSADPAGKQGAAAAPEVVAKGGGDAAPDDGEGSQIPGGPASGVADAPAGSGRGASGGSVLPTEQVEPTAAKGGKLPDGKAPAAAQPAAAAPAPGQPAAPETAAAPPSEAAAPPPPAGVPVEAVAVRRVPVDADQFGQEGVGTGGEPDPEMLAILKNKNVTFDEVGVADIKAGRIDPRIIAVLTKLSHEHKIVVSCMCSDHPRMTTSGFVSNHTYGRGLDIASIDGEIVGPGSALAREVASELSQFPESIRGDEIGSPFAISGPGYFTDAAHQNHIHVGFKTEISPDFKPPPGLGADAPTAAAAAPAAVAAVPGTPAAPTAPAAPVDPARGSGLFGAITPAEPAKRAGAGAANRSGIFAALDPKAPAAPVAPPPPAGAPVDAAAAGAVDVSAVSDAYPGDDATKEQYAAWMAKLAEKRGLPPQLPVMASLVESGLKNLNFGDADSVGFFQMRLSIWNNGPYAGYPDDPAKQVDWFLDAAQQVKTQRLARGQSVTDPDQFGDWIADVERPAEQYRGRYQLQLDQANSLLKPTPAPATAPEAAPAQAVAEAGVPPTMAQGPGRQAEAALAEAKKFLGTPYKWGGSTPQTGFDCSGLVQWAYAQQGIQIPRVTDQQILAANGTAVKRSELLPGDLVFFRDSTGYVHHVGMSLGGDKFIHAPHTGDVVKISSLDEPYYKEQFTGGRRFDKAATAAPAAPAAAAPAVAPAPVADPVAVASAQAAVARDAAEAARRDSGLFKAISVQEARNHEEARALASDGSARRRSDSAMFLQAITPERAAEAKAAAQSAPVPPPAPEAAPSATPAAAAPDVAAAAPAGPGPDLAGVPADYPGNDAGQKALARWLAKHAEKAGLPPELPVMASLVESGVRNLDFGDADSVGFFQMRTSIWDHGEYAGYGKNPGLQAKWFIDHALAVKKQAIARGDAGFGKDPSGWGEWIADIERPAEPYRGRYQLRLEEARRLLR